MVYKHDDKKNQERVNKKHSFLFRKKKIGVSKEKLK